MIQRLIDRLLDKLFWWLLRRKYRDIINKCMVGEFGRDSMYVRPLTDEEKDGIQIALDEEDLESLEFLPALTNTPDDIRKLTDRYFSKLNSEERRCCND